MNFPGGNMKYIEETFLKALEFHKDRFVVLSVLDKISRYRKTFEKEFPRAANQSIHIIGMIHTHWNRSARNSIEEDVVVESQNQVIKTLTEIQPEIIGVEGFCGDKFTPQGIVEENQKLNMKRELLPNEVQTLVNQMLDDPEVNPILNFQMQNPHIQFSGTEQLDLLRLQVATMMGASHESQKRALTKQDPLTVVLDGTVRLRSLMMIAKLSRHLTKHSKKVGALPVGHLHLLDIRELGSHLGADWKFYNATSLNENDLPT